MNKSGEVLESSTREVMAECRDKDSIPPLGSLVKIETTPVILAVVYNVFTYCIEPNRRPTAYGLSIEELEEEQPQIFELLKTAFQAVIVGFYQDGVYHQFSPPLPPSLHSFVYPCSEEELKSFTEGKDFLRMIMNLNRGQSDEIIISFVRQAWTAYKRDKLFLIDMGKELSILFKDDYDRLRSIMRRIMK
ncbi:MAG TPA: hypothetical protein PL110_10525 [Candidatus Eremiobacteraeota bacterium]|nr:MAG: hypothetical protein BWY64_03406 [bacterium ADurb.Bin363]HPZ08538.1 hypothetical protein [Candidatus Eremiobacteraeota bacterium]